MSSDPAPGPGLLLGGESRPILSAALPPGLHITGPPQPTDVRFVPGRSITVAYAVPVAGDRGNDMVVMVASQGLDVPAGTCIVTPPSRTESSSVAVWTPATDPFLPGLVAALDRGRVQGLLEDLGAPPGPVSCRLRTYRPGRRAVVEVLGTRARLFLKVLRPDRVAALHRRHQILVGSVGSPRSLGYSPSLGLVALEALPGLSLRDALASPGDGLVGPDAIVALLEDLPEVGADLVAPLPPRLRAIEHGAMLADVMQPFAAGVADEVRIIADAVATHDFCEAADPTTVHGDLHDAQLICDRRGGLVGVVDVDTVGRGHRLDDLANLVGHISNLALASPDHHRAVAYGQAVTDRAERVVDPVDLRVAAAATVLGLATGPYRVHQPDWPAAVATRIDLARGWLESAGLAPALTTARLREVSSGLHRRPRLAAEADLVPNERRFT